MSVMEKEQQSALAADDENALSEEELDALREASHEDSTGHGALSAHADDGHCLYDFRDPVRVFNGCLPGLESVHDAFVTGMQRALRALLGRSVEIDVVDVALTRLGDYRNSLPAPVSVHASVVDGRDCPVFLIAEGEFVYACADTFIDGRSRVRPTRKRKFSASERRLAAMLARHVFAELTNAWASLCALKFAEPETCWSTGMGGSAHGQLMLVSRFQVDLSPGGGEFHLALPEPLFNGLRTFPGAGPCAEDSAHQWRSKFVERVNDVQMRARAVFPAVNVSVADLIALAPGDFIAINRPNTVNVMVGNRVLYSAESTTSNGFAAVKVVAPAARQRG